MSDMFLMCFHNNENIFAAHDAKHNRTRPKRSEKSSQPSNTTPAGDIQNIKFVPEKWNPKKDDLNSFSFSTLKGNIFMTKNRHRQLIPLPSLLLSITIFPSLYGSIVFVGSFGHFSGAAKDGDWWLVRSWNMRNRKEKGEEKEKHRGQRMSQNGQNRKKTFHISLYSNNNNAMEMLFEFWSFNGTTKKENTRESE